MTNEEYQQKMYEESLKQTELLEKQANVQDAVVAENQVDVQENIVLE